MLTELEQAAVIGDLAISCLVEAAIARAVIVISPIGGADVGVACKDSITMVLSLFHPMIAEA